MSYSVNGQTYEFWSSKNQHILDRLVDREVYCCLTQEIEYILRRAWDDENDAPFTVDDIENYYEKECSECGCAGYISEVDEDENGDAVYECSECKHRFTEEEYADLDDVEDEIYEWWAVSGWLGDKLKQQGCCVIDSYGKSFWGRRCTGQSISLDGVVCRIAYEMGILDGQKYDWGDTP